MNSFLNLDQSVFFLINGNHSPFWDEIMIFFTQAYTWAAFFIIFLFFIFKKYKTKKGLVILLVLIIAMTFSDQFSSVIKELVKRFRPSHEPFIENMVHSALKRGGLYGFFSAHASNSMVMAVFSSLIFRNKTYNWLAFSWMFIIGYTRIYLGMHYPLDVICGWIAGVLIGYAFYKIITFLEKHLGFIKKDKLSDNSLSSSEVKYFLIILGTIVLTVFTIVIRMHHYHLI